MNSQNKLLITTLLLLIVIVGGVYWLKTHPRLKKVEISKDNIIVTTVDLAVAEGRDRIPPALPDTLPVETENVTESYNQSYTDKGVSLTGYTYTSKKTPAEIFAIYKEYMSKNGYNIILDSLKSDAPSVLQARKQRNELMVVATVFNNETKVQVTYTERK